MNGKMGMEIRENMNIVMGICEIRVGGMCPIVLEDQDRFEQDAGFVIAWQMGCLFYYDRNWSSKQGMCEGQQSKQLLA